MGSPLEKNTYIPMINIPYLHVLVNEFIVMNIIITIE